MRTFLLLIILLLAGNAFGQDRFVKKFENSSGAITGAVVYIVHEVTGDSLVLTEDVSNAGRYYRDNVSYGTYKIYVNGVLAETGYPHGVDRQYDFIEAVDSDGDNLISGTAMEDASIPWVAASTDFQDSARFVAEGAIGSTEIAAGAVSTSELADGAATSPKYQNRSVTQEKAAQNLLTYIRAAGYSTATTKDSVDGTANGDGENLLLNTSYRGVGTRFVPATSYEIGEVQVYLGRKGTLGDSLICEIWSNSATLPSAELVESPDTLAFNAIDTFTVGNEYGSWYAFEFPTTVNTASYDTLWIVLKSADGGVGDASNLIEWEKESVAAGKTVRWSGSSFTQIATGTSLWHRAREVAYDTTGKGVTIQTTSGLSDSIVTTSKADADFLRYIQGAGKYSLSLGNELTGTTGGAGENLGINSSYRKIATRVKTNGRNVRRVQANIYKGGAGPHTLKVVAEIWTNSASLPGTELGESIDSVAADTLPTTADSAYYTFNFPNSIDVTGNDSIWVVLSTTAGDAANYIEWGVFTDANGRTARWSNWTKREDGKSLLSRVYYRDVDTSYVKTQVSDTADALRTDYRQTLYGLNLQNFLSKVGSQWQTRYPDTVTVAFVGNSITAGTGSGSGFVSLDSSSLEAYYPNAVLDIQRWGYAGYSMNELSRVFESVVIEPNVDLVVFTELSTQGQIYDTWFEYMVRRVREKSTADIVIQIPNPTSGGTPTDKQRRFARDVAKRYNAELVNVHRIFVDSIAVSGNTLTEFVPDGTHPGDDGILLYQTAWNQHFDTTNVERQYSSNPLDDVESIIEFEEPVIFFDSSRVQLTTSGGGAWSARAEGDSVSVYVLSAESGQVGGDTITVAFDGVGFDLYYIYSTSGGDVDFYIDGQKPSAIRVAGRPLEYATLMTWDSGNTNDDRNYRGFKAFVLDTTRTGQWQVVVTDAVNDSFKLVDPNLDTLGTGHFDTDFTSTDGDIFIPARYGRPNQSQWLNYSDYGVGDKFYFTVKRKWVDTLDMNGTNLTRGRVNVMGLANGAHTLQIIKQDSSPTKFDKLVVYRPKLGRQ